MRIADSELFETVEAKDGIYESMEVNPGQVQFSADTPD